MTYMHCDIETYSSVDLGKCGVYKYAEAEDFEILLFGVSIDGGDVEVYDLTGGKELPSHIKSALTDPAVTKFAHNSGFERICLSRYLNLPPHTYLPPSQWKCTMTWAAYMGLPLSLKGAGAVLGLDKQKMEEGKELIRFFCVPCAPTKSNNQRKRNRPEDAPEKWEMFKKYNGRDVEVEMQIEQRLAAFPVPDSVWEEYWISEEINDRGILVDGDLVKNAIRIDGKVREELKEKMKGLTALENPNSVQQLAGWLGENGVEVGDLGKKTVKKMLEDADGEVKEALLLRQQLAKSSVKKYQAMENAACTDGRIRGMFMFYGANRSGRFSGRMVQLQNLPQNHLPDLAEARELVRQGNLPALQLLYPDIPDTLSQLIRTAFIAPPDHLLYVADFSAIEARVLAWMAGEQWRIDAFANGEDIYCASASQMFHVPVQKHGVNGELRQKGKVAELALGYGGSVRALESMGALDMGLDELELDPLVKAWRAASPNIVKFWWAVDRSAKDAVFKKKTTKVKNLSFTYQSGYLFITLPSGRRLAYVKPRKGENRFGEESITYEGVGGTKKWERIETYGPKLVENIIQATARDVLCFAMRNLREKRICMHIHDELVIEAPEDTSLEEICEVMGRTPPWAEGLILRSDGFVTPWYKKD
ncbi:MAG: DNA polymerase [Oscillospiraceae bacterium]|nr:DNA polymerase [Oscillospiraceae bacterium]